jgi:hypothetical protein
MSKKTASFVFRLLSVVILLILLFSAQGVTPAHATGILYATPTGAGNCSSWVNACTLQTALVNAVNGDEIWVAAGTHKPTTGTDRSATFQLKDGIALYGGFVGTETAREQRDTTANVTILSGDLNGNDNDNVRFDEPTRADNSYHVVKGATGARLDGFTITAGNANVADDGGGGMANEYDSSPTLINIIFSNNSAQKGGGMSNSSSNPTLLNVIFSGNSASWWGGGGMFNWEVLQCLQVLFSLTIAP